MSKPTEAIALDLKDVELNEIDPEKQPMAPTLGETNGELKVKVLDEEPENKFTGLSKEELLKVAGTPAWVRTRWALLILFWLGWLGMLVGAVLIIVQAPRCRPLPPLEWWQKGALYQIGAVEAFQDTNGDGVGDLAGIKQHMDDLGALKVKGLVIGPIHATVADRPDQTRLTEIDQIYGTLDNFTQLLEAARKKSIMVVLDLTPNYKGRDPWFNSTALDSQFQNDVKEALNFWLEKGVAGIRLGGIERLEDLGFLEECKNITTNYSTEGKNRVLIAMTDHPDKMKILEQLNQTSLEFLSSRYLLDTTMAVPPSGSELASWIHDYLEAAGERWTSWSVGGPNVGHMASLVKQDVLRLYNLLLFTLPGTPFTSYGDEIGLEDLPGQPAKPIMHWDNTENFGFSSRAPLVSQGDTNRNLSVETQKEDKHSLLALYKRLSELKGKERSLLHGDFVPLHQSLDPHVYAYLRVWDQNDRFLVALNLGVIPAAVTLKHEQLPTSGVLVLSSDPQRQEGSVDLHKLELAPSEGLLIKFPYTA